MIQLSVNNEITSIEKSSSVEQLLEQLGFEKNKVAIAVNGDFVPRSTYPQHTLQADDKVDVLAAVQGG